MNVWPIWRCLIGFLGPKLHKFGYEFDTHPPSCIFLLDLGSLSLAYQYTPTLVEIVRNSNAEIRVGDIIIQAQIF